MSTSIRDITTKLQSASILPAIPPLMHNSIHEIFNIQTDLTSVVNAEEATEFITKKDVHCKSDSPSPISSGDLQRKFEVYNKIGEQEFDNTILFKHHKRKQKRADMTGSTSNLSSSSSDDKETSINRPTLMNLSAVGALPDLRSPDSIRSDIQHKEKILADVLNFDKAKIFEWEGNNEKHNLSCDLETDAVSNYNVPEDINTLVFTGQSNDDSVLKLKEEEEVTIKQDVAELKNEVLEVNKEREKAVKETDEEFCVKPFKGILPEFEKIAQCNQSMVNTIPGKNLS